MYFTPDLIFPFFIVETIIAENNDVVIKDTTAKILKSDWVTPVPEKLNAMPAVEAALVVLPKVEPSFCTTPIKTPDKANKNGAAATVANVMKIT